MTRHVKESAAGHAVVEQTWDLVYRHSIGETVGRFFEALRDRTIVGRRCDGCRRVLVPPRSYCDRCHRTTGEWVTVGRRGTVEMFTIVYHQFRHMPPPPYALGYVRLEGADTALLGYIRGIDASEPRKVTGVLKTGSTAEVRFVDAPTGRVTDYWFELVPS